MPHAFALPGDLDRALPAGVRRMVVGHSVQRGGEITSTCGGKVVRVDVGMSRGVMASDPQVLEISKRFGVRVLRHDFRV